MKICGLQPATVPLFDSRHMVEEPTRLDPIVRAEECLPESRWSGFRPPAVSLSTARGLDRASLVVGR